MIGIVLAVAVVAIIVVTYNAPGARVRRELRKAQRRRIADVGDGQLGKIVGQARVHQRTLTAPLTGRPCVYFLARVEQRHSTGRSTTWRKLIEERDGVAFVVEDDSGRAIVDPTDARISLEIDSRSKSGTFDDPTPAEREFLERFGQSGQGWFLNKTLRYFESVIEVGETVAVLGAGVREPDPDAQPVGTYRGDQPTLLRLTSSQSFPLVISDREETTR